MLEEMFEFMPFNKLAVANILVKEAGIADKEKALRLATILCDNCYVLPKDDVDRVITNMRSKIMDLKNEMCLLCGRYKNAHLGECDQCRWDAA